jgi:hypothetical protein
MVVCTVLCLQYTDVRILDTINIHSGHKVLGFYTFNIRLPSLKIRTMFCELGISYSKQDRLLRELGMLYSKQERL